VDVVSVGFEASSDYIDLSIDTGFYGSGLVLWSQDSRDLDSLSTLSGKLKLHCLVLFSSLSSWEKEALNSSEWLEKATSMIVLLLLLASKGDPSLIVQSSEGRVSSSPSPSTKPRVPLPFGYC
jgi:hypothetical protein